MSSPPPSNILLDPLSELTAALRLNAFGLSANPAATEIILERTYPITPEDVQRVAVESVRRGETGQAVQGTARVGLAGGEGEVRIVLDRRGFTLLEATTSSGKTYPNTTFESLEALLIAISPAYVQAMTAEIERRFAENDYGEVEGGVEGEAAGKGDQEEDTAGHGSAEPAQR